MLDGAVGTELYKRGMPSGISPEKWCLQNPDILEAVHLEYKRAGADILYTCTFGANRIKLSRDRITNIVFVNKKLASLAKKAAGRDVLVAGDIGPTGEFIKPFGNLDFDKAVDVFKEQVRGLLLGGVDLFVIETMMDIQEARAALIAVKELTDKFTIVTMTYEKHGRTLNGTDPVSALITLQSLGADAVGCNCSTGPRDMARIISKMKPYAKIPLVAKPNAGFPKLVKGETRFDMGSKRFAGFAKEFVSRGANMMGGCCGTTPEHIYELKKALKGVRPVKPVRSSICALSSARGYFIPGEDKPFAVVGEKINPTGKKKMQKDLLHGKMELVRQAAKEQERNGASLLDVNVGAAGVDEKKAICKAISILSVITNLPLVIDSTDVDAIERALRLYPGRALINSISGEEKRAKKLFSLAKKYGAMFILLPIDGKVIPATFTERKKVIKKLYTEALRNGFTKDDIVIDGLVMAFSSDHRAPCETLKTIEWSLKTLKCKTIVGLSNVSFGMPKREIINASFLKLAKEKGLTLAIADPLVLKGRSDRLATNLLLAKDEGGRKFIGRYSKKESTKKEKVLSSVFSGGHIFRAIIDGDKENIKAIVKKVISKGITPSVILKKHMVPAIIKVGKLFDRKEYFLPQLIASAETMKKGFQCLEPLLKKHELNYRKKSIVLIATVKGDIHDIGKNIVALLLRNHGFKIVDLGKDVSAGKIINEIKRYSPDVVGLSALMTTTMVNMKDVINLSSRLSKRPIFMVGGAAVTKAYALSIGAQYARDGVDAVRIADRAGKK